jgi:hypothetical protein
MVCIQQLVHALPHKLLVVHPFQPQFGTLGDFAPRAVRLWVRPGPLGRLPPRGKQLRGNLFRGCCSMCQRASLAARLRGWSLPG